MTLLFHPLAGASHKGAGEPQKAAYSVTGENLTQGRGKHAK